MLRSLPLCMRALCCNYLPPRRLMLLALLWMRLSTRHLNLLQMKSIMHFRQLVSPCHCCIKGWRCTHFMCVFFGVEYAQSFSNAEHRPRGCWRELPKQYSSSSFRECHFSYSPEVWSQSGAPGPKVSSRRRICRQSFSLDNLRLKRPDAGEELCTTPYTVPVSPQCPQVIVLPTLPVFQGAAVSCERIYQSPPRKRSGTGSLASTSEVFRAARLAVPCRSSASGHRASSSKYTEGSLERLVPLEVHMAVWEPLSSVSRGPA